MNSDSTKKIAKAHFLAYMDVGQGREQDAEAWLNGGFSEAGLGRMFADN